MSEETVRVLKEALEFCSEARENAARQKQQCLNDVADGLTSKIEDIAKQTAHAQPEVTKGLGREGVQQFRAELMAAATALADEIRGAVADVPWPTTQARVDPSRIHTALFQYLFGARVDRLATVFKSHGYSTSESVHNHQNLISPQSLYDQSRFAPVANALNSLAEAERSVAAAKADDDRSSVEDIWGD